VAASQGSLIFWGAVILVIGCVIGCAIGYSNGYRNGENNAIRDIDSMEQRPLKQKLGEYRRTRNLLNVQNRDVSKNQNRDKKK
jgi:membrane protein DedA with SNARE-associated domain